MPKQNRMENPPFPIMEIFGYAADADTSEAIKHQSQRRCPFAGNECEKYRQYGFGYCSVTYAAKDDNGVRYTYAVCDHRVDGAPLSHVIQDYFGNVKVEIVPEVVISDPRTSFDYVVVRRENGIINQAIAIETQAIDLRGGGVGPAFEAWNAGRPQDWRAYFTAEANNKRRRDTVAYGVNMANIYKRLGVQVVTKGAYLKAIGIPLYVLMQDRPFNYLRRRIRFTPSQAGDPHDITFVTFDYTGRRSEAGQFEFNHVATVRTTLESYAEALAIDSRASADQREQFLKRVKAKLKQAEVAPDLFSAGGQNDLRDGT